MQSSVWFADKKNIESAPWLGKKKHDKCATKEVSSSSSTTSNLHFNVLTLIVHSGNINQIGVSYVCLFFFFFFYLSLMVCLKKKQYNYCAVKRILSDMLGWEQNSDKTEDVSLQ